MQYHMLIYFFYPAFLSDLAERPWLKVSWGSTVQIELPLSRGFLTHFCGTKTEAPVQFKHCNLHKCTLMLQVRSMIAIQTIYGIGTSGELIWKTDLSPIWHTTIRIFLKCNFYSQSQNTYSKYIFLFSFFKKTCRHPPVKPGVPCPGSHRPTHPILLPTYTEKHG